MFALPSCPFGVTPVVAPEHHRAVAVANSFVFASISVFAREDFSCPLKSQSPLKSL